MQEERFSSKKKDENFPLNPILYCLREAKITLSQVDHVVFYEKPFLKLERLIETYLALPWQASFFYESHACMAEGQTVFKEEPH